MKFLNHLDLVENEARRLKMYRIAATSYTPGITTSGNIIMDTGNNIPKWWDGSAWRDFSYNTSGGVNTQNAYATSAISSSGIKLRLSGSGAAGNTTDDVQFLGAGGATVSLGNASQIVITTTDTDTNTTYGLNVASGTTKIRLTGSDSTTNDVDIVAGTGFMSVVRTNANKLTLNNETYNIGISTPTTAVSGKNVAIDLGRSSGNLVDEVGIQDGTYITNSIVNAGTFKGDLSASDGTAGEAERVLAKSNKWITIASINPNTNTQNAYAVSAANGSNTSREKIVLTGSGAAGSTTDFVEIGAGTGLTIARAGDVITLTNSNPTNTNTTYTATVATGITLSGTTFTVNSWSQISLASGGSTQGETAGRWYRVNTDTAGKLIVNVPWANTNTNTQRAAGVGMTLNTNTLDVNTWGAVSVTAASTAESSSKWYKVHTDANDKLIVRVPWENTQTANTNTQATYTIPVSAGAGNTAVVTLTGGGAASTTETLTFAGTTNEVAVTETTGNNGTVTIGLPDDVTIGNDLTVTTDASVGGNLVVTGNLTINGTSTTVNTETVTIQDNMILLNSNAAATPSENAGIEVERGNSANVNMQWIESSDTWYLTESVTNANGGNLVSKKIIQNLFSTVTGNSGTATANASATALAVTGTNGITTIAANQGIQISGAGMSQGTVMTLSASSIGSATNKRANVTHALATKDVIVRTYLIAGEGGALEEIYANVTVMSTTVVKLEFSAQPTSNVRVVITAVRTPIAGTSVAYA